MKKFIVIALTMILTTIVGVNAKVGDKVGVTFSETEYDFGTVSQDSDPVVHEFTITNAGKDAVAILSATASCGCTKPQYDPKPLKPGDSAKIKVTFLPAGQRGDINKFVTLRVRSGKGKTEKIKLALTGAVIPTK